VGRTRVWHDFEAAPELEDNAPEPPVAHERLIRAERDFEYYLEQSHGGDGDVARASLPSAFAPWLHSLSERRPTFRAYVDTLQDLARTDPDRARAFLDDVYDPFLQNDLLPIVYAYLAEAEEALADQLHGISSRTDTTMRVALVTGGVAVILAVVLGMLLWRSIHAPIQALHAAALRLGHGHLDTRVDVRSRDELGVLADAFNKMAGELGRTTVSVSNLENVFDSMAGALLIFDTDGRITRVNQAALNLLGYGRDALLGRPFDEICPAPRADPLGPIVQTNDEGIVAIEEKEFLRRDATRVPVSFSGAALRSADGPLQGYVCVAQDLTERKRIEERIQSSLAEKELLLREVHHRVKNNMQVISSLLAIQSGYTNDPEIRAQFEESQNRIRSMALIHEQLYHTSDFSDLDLRAYLELLTAHLMRSSDRSERTSLDLHVQALASDIDQAMACGLIVNELVTNSLKHAFPEEVCGRIRVSLHEDTAGDRILSVSDNGRGLPENLDVGRSHALGLALVEKLVKQFQGRMDFCCDKGTEVRIVFPSDSSQQDLAS
jgi:PAS domain S-box-containing protein